MNQRLVQFLTKISKDRHSGEGRNPGKVVFQCGNFSKDNMKNFNTTYCYKLK